MTLSAVACNDIATQISELTNKIDFRTVSDQIMDSSEEILANGGKNPDLYVLMEKILFNCSDDSAKKPSITDENHCHPQTRQNYALYLLQALLLKITNSR